MRTSVDKLRKDFLAWWKPVENKHKGWCKSAGVPYVSVLWRSKQDWSSNNHLFIRALERELPKAHLGSMFEKLLRHHLCELLYWSTLHAVDSRNFVDKRTTWRANYKGHSLVFQLQKVVDDAGNVTQIKLYPLTVLYRYHKATHDYEINIKETYVL